VFPLFLRTKTPGRARDDYDPYPMIPNPTLREYVRHHAEDRPGIYRMLGPQEELLYVGKSIRVKSRLLSYFRAEPGEKAARLIRDTHSILWEYVPNEFAALIREMRLIKRWRPRYNVEHKRRRSFAFIKITNETAPRLLPVSRVLPDGGTYFGPFPRPGFLTLTVRELAQVLGLRDCPGTVPVFFDDQLEIFEQGHTPRCLRVPTGSCLGPCCGACSSVDYAQSVETARRFLEGRSREPLKLLEREMERASASLDFEYAALVRDRLDRLDTLQKELIAFRGRVEGLDLVYRVPGFKGDDRLYLIRKGLVEDEFPRPRGKSGRLAAARRVEALFEEPAPLVDALSPEAASEILLVARWFRLREGELGRASKPADWLSAYRPAPADSSE
jgi:excinuclease ABC subunit C